MDENEKTIEELLEDAGTFSYVIPAYHCPVCGEDVEGTIMGIYMHLVGHHAELLIKVNKLIEVFGGVES